MKEKDITKIHGIPNPRMVSKESLKKRLLSVKEASLYLGMSIPALRERIWAGQIPIVRPDRRIFIDIYDIDKWIEQHKIRYTY